MESTVRVEGVDEPITASWVFVENDAKSQKVRVLKLSDTKVSETEADDVSVMDSGIRILKEEKDMDWVAVAQKISPLEEKALEVENVKMVELNDLELKPPLRVAASESPDANGDARVILGSETPIDHPFNSFAPCLDELMSAPKKKRSGRDSVAIPRQLDFSSPQHLDFSSRGDVLDDTMEEKEIYESFLKMIVSNQIDQMLIDEDGPCPRTPGQLPLLTGIAETCPVVPMKPTPKPREFDLGICRKLKF
ncbi:hypothetical protein QJS04_geneDACA022635 [Acorus gramineus]|uniref:Uncharacterized protein n=1 Tax=Acorus gramineus TaxID=55184 RepID=A0AAV9B556_ACOGR|nr:hypothetical protein QJS04_geneDACA022635 [Acorus gramineus]